MIAPALIVLRPGDKVLVTIADDNLHPDTVTTVLAGLRKDFPGVHFTILAGATGIAIAPPD